MPGAEPSDERAGWEGRTGRDGTPSTFAPPDDPIFVFTDTLTVHRSLEDAAGYHEYRETLLAYDQRGQVFEIPPVFRAAPVRRPENRREELVRRLRRELILLVISRPGLIRMSK